MVTHESFAETGSAYDPWEHAKALGIPVHVRRLRKSHGLWFPDYGEILLADHLKPWAQRCVLAHEVGHAVLGHRDDPPENEWAADQFAAHNLISPKLLASVVDKHGSDVAAICKDLGVTSRLLRAAFSPFASLKVSPGRTA